MTFKSLFLLLIFLSACSNHVVQDTQPSTVGGGTKPQLPAGPTPLKTPERVFVSCSNPGDIVEALLSDGSSKKGVCPNYHSMVEITPYSVTAKCTVRRMIRYYFSLDMSDSLEMECKPGEFVPFNWSYGKWQIQCNPGEVVGVRYFSYGLFSSVIDHFEDTPCATDGTFDNTRDRDWENETWGMSGIKCPSSQKISVRFSKLQSVYGISNGFFLDYACTAGEYVDIRKLQVFEENFYDPPTA